MIVMHVFHILLSPFIKEFKVNMNDTCLFTVYIVIQNDF